MAEGMCQRVKAKYVTKTEPGLSKTIEYPVIQPQSMQHTDGFMLLGFNSWEDVHSETLAAAVTNVLEFHISKESVGFQGHAQN